MTAGWLRSRLTELVLAVFLVMGIIGLSEQLKYKQRELTRPESWLTVNEVYVPDHPAGSNPEMIYDRQVFEPFTGFWLVEVQRKGKSGLWSPVCTGSGISPYDPSLVIEDDRVEWEWFVGKPCTVPPGIYRLRTTHTMTRPEWPSKYVFNLSNEFRVLQPE